MATSSVPIFSTDPSVQAGYLQVQQRQALAAALMQDGLKPLDINNRQVGGVAYRVSPMEGLAKVLQAYGGQKMMGDSNQEMGNLLAGQNDALVRAMGGGQPAQQPDPATSALGAGAASGSVGPTNENAARLAAVLGQGQQPQPQSAPAGGSPFNPTGLPPELAARAYLQDPSKYLETIIGQSAPTDLQKTAIAAGLRPGTAAYQQFMQANLKKQNYIAPVSIRPGGGVMGQDGKITTTPAAAPEGFQAVQGADGSWSYQPVAGGTQAVTASVAAKEQGKAPYQVIEGFDPNTQAPTRNYAGNVLTPPVVPGATPPAGRQQFNQVAGAAFPGNVYTQDTVRILQEELKAEQAKPNPDQRTVAGLQREVAKVQGATGVQAGPALGQGQGATNAQNELSTAWTAQQGAHQTAQTNVSLLQNMRELTDKAITGFEPDRRTFLAKLGAYAGIKSMDDKASASDLLNKYSSQLIAGLAQKGGMSTDAARELVMAGTPNSHMQAGAIKEAIDGLQAREQMTQARTHALQPYANKRDPAGFQGAATTFDQVADPRAWQWMAIKDPKQRQAFAAKVMASDPKFPQRITALEQMGALNGAR